MKSLKEAHIRNNWDSFLAYRERRLQGIQSGLLPLDRYLLGLGGVTVLQGETGTNKSTLALQIVHHNLKLGHSALMIDKENGQGRIRSRLVCQAHNVSETRVKVAPVEELRKMAAPVLKYPLHVYTDAIKDHEQLRERVQEMLAASDKPCILLVDSLQAMTPVDSDQRVSLEKWMYFFDELKVQSDGRLTVIVVSEKNRASYGSSEIGGAKGSNSVEYKAEVVLDMRAAEGNVIVKVAKSRDGIKGAEFELQKVLETPGNPNSFTFNLKAVGGGEF